MKTLPSSLSIHRKLQSGFSLIETMVVIVLVSIA
ncbi:MAG: prepilin-type N-terminal cleavage/methylation domain-containing protein, partial [Burkholderiaceae bacterium]|nr:prepilin-type N-terminal cleavage/methylation domain-containing protein [Burkholderiaceae bacterium]